MKSYLLLLAFISVAYSTIAGHPDPRMEKFDQYIKQEAKIKNHHPFLLFSNKDIPVLRKKMNDPYFKNYTADLLHFADSCLKKYPDNNKFPFTENPNYQTIAEALVMAYLLTDDEKYSHKAIELTKTFVNDHYLKVPVRDSGKFKDHLNNGNSISFILNTIAVVYDSLYNEMTNDERFLIRKGLAYFCKITYEMAITQEYGLGFHKNYRAGGMGALGLACLALKDDIDLEVHEWLDKAMRISISWCNVAIKPDGVYPEGTTYMYYMLRNQLLFFEALKKNHDMDCFKKTNLKNALIWSLWSSLPWKYEFDNFSDGAYSTYMHDMPFIMQKNFPGYGDYLIYKVYGDKLRYRSNPWAILFGHKPKKIILDDSVKSGFWSGIFGSGKSCNGFDPDDKLGLAKLFPYGGIAGFRTGWGKNDMLLLTYATDYEYAAHSQADRGQFNIYAYGKKWAIDSGYGNDAKIANSATPSEAHNIVMIDGKGEAFDPSMRQSGTFADIVDYTADKGLGFVKINQKDAYDWYVRYHYLNKKEYNPVIKAFRNILFVNKGETPPYVLIYDDIQKDAEKHNYAWQFHTAPGNLVSTEANEITITPSSYSGKAIFANGSGSWDDVVSPGFNIFRERPGVVSFKVNVPKAGEYVLWAFGRGSPYTWAETEVLINNKSYGRFKIGQTQDFCWVKFSRNKKKMHYPQMVQLQSGENIIELKGVSSGYEVAKLLLTMNPKFIPQGVNPAKKGTITFGIANLISKEDAVIREIDDKSTAECQVKMIHPENCRIKTGFYQPSRVPLHPRILFETEAVNPDFLAMIYPNEGNMEKPKIVPVTKKGLINTTISWNKYSDHILLNLNKKTITFKGIKTDAKILFCRFNKSNKLIRLLASDGKTLQINNEKAIKLSKNKTMIINK
jgi:heparinase II/III-like protein/uncharacterized protein DUF4962